MPIGARYAKYGEVWFEIESGDESTVVLRSCWRDRVLACECEFRTDLPIGVWAV